MRMRDNSFIIAVALLLTGNIAIVTAQPNELALDIVVSKKQFVRGENAPVTITLRNRSAIAIMINPPYLDYGYLDLHLLGSDGKRYPWRKPTLREFAVTQKLSSNDSIQTIYSLVPSFGVGDYKYKYYPTGKNLPVGRYRLFGTYESVNGRIQSNEISFDVVEPQGREREAFDLFSRATETEIAGKYDQAISILNTLVERYPESVYAPMALEQKMGTYRSWKKDESKAKETALELISNYPNSAVSLEAKSYLLVYVYPPEKKSERSEFLKYVSESFPNTFIGRDFKRIRDREKETK